jgi:hypothetical protein
MNRRLPTAALMLAFCMLPPAPALAQLTGTLFTSPEQREYLDYLRQEFLATSSERGFDIDEAEIPEIPEAIAEAEEAAGPVVYTLGGIVSLRDGTQRIWLNGKALSEAELPGEARLVRDSGMSVLHFSTANGTYLLRPGQTLELTAGSVVENYQRQVEEMLPEAQQENLLDEAGDQTATEAEQQSLASQDQDQATADPTAEDRLAEPAADPDAGLNAQDVIELMQAVQALQGSDDN